MITHLQTWFVITNKEKLDMKALFYAPWSENTNTHITTFYRQLDRRQVECAKNQVTITDSDNVDHFVVQMYLCNIFESKFFDDWEEAQDKTWAATKPLFMTQYNKDQRKLYRESKRTPYDSNASFREITTPAPQSITHDTSDKSAYEAAIEYAQALEEQTTVQAAEILALKSVGGTNTTVVGDFAASAVAAPSTASSNLTDLQIMVAQLATTFATLSKNNRRGDNQRSHTNAGGGDRKNGRAPKRNNNGGRTNLWVGVRG